MASDNIEQALNAYLVASTDAHDAVGDRIYWVDYIGPSQPTMPYATYFLVSDPHVPHSFGHTDSGQARIQFNVYDDNKTVALSKANALRDVLDQYQGTMDGKTVESINCTGVRVPKVPDLEIYQGMFDAMVVYYD